MPENRDRLSVFLTVVILLLLAAIGVYSFIYRDKILETMQGITKKTETPEKFTISGPNTVPERVITPTDSSLKVKETKSVLDEEIKNPSEKKVPKRDNDPLLLTDNKDLKKDRKDIEPPPELNDPKIKKISGKDGLQEYRKNLPDTVSHPKKSSVSSEEKTAKIHTKKKKKGKGKSSPRKKSLHKKNAKKSALAKRVAYLEKKLGIRKKDGGNLSKRIYRLEKILIKRKKKG
ncbi:MAG TPA: hypothetical protein PK453_16410 [Leptospiraceae bacterium]|nr:hypothetical protein [Leptospiraceae bacterium]HMY69068.1 hypothetical protein [Leptospiraceae bacterium]HNF15253.1 hypothetical protein [Leptospiraceae bacterium]HNF25408.1 hypothetical protein [Leptospiraceae bacterium]HNI97738.1 hypothetical protein [Leptospiraceae bacterium]